MSSATLSRFTVPLDGSQPQGMLHPKLKYRFRVTFENFGAKGAASTELTKQVVSFPRPTLQFEHITQEFILPAVMLGLHCRQHCVMMPQGLCLN